MKITKQFDKSFTKYLEIVRIKYSDPEFNKWNCPRDHATKIEEGKESVIIRLTIDEDALADQLGRRAARNKNGTASLNGGLIKAKVIDRRKVFSHIKEEPIPEGMEEVKD